MIRKLLPKDATRMHEWMQDVEITKNFQTNFASFSIDKINSFINSSAQQTQESANLNYAIIDDNDTYMGTISLKNINRTDKNAEYAIVTMKEAHGKGFAKKATEDILKIAFDELLLEKVYLYVSIKNIAANKFYQKVGFVEEGVFRNHVIINQELTSIRWYSILKDEYQKQKASF